MYAYIKQHEKKTKTKNQSKIKTERDFSYALSVTI